MNKKVIIPVILLGIIVAAVVAYMMYNKQHADISKEKTDYEVKVTDMISEFGTDAAAAHTKYNETVVQLDGEIYKSEKGDSSQVVIFDEGTDYQVNVELLEPNDGLKKGGYVTLKAFYKGAIEGEADFGIPGEIQLKKGIVIE